MDFHSLSRRDLQALCKKNRIPANMTNVAMADALQALQTVEGIEEIKEAAQFQSPLKARVRSPNLPCTNRRTSARRAPVPDEPEGQQGSPLPRARRVAIKASEIMKLVSEGEEEKKEGPEEIPKTPAVRTGRKPQAATRTRRNQSSSKKEEKEPQEEGPKEIPKTPAASTARNTRRRASKRDETDGDEGPLEVAITPATRYGRRASTRKGAEGPVTGEEKQEEFVGFRSTRRTRQSVRETTLDAVPDVGRRTTRAKAAVKMAALAQGEEKEERKDIAIKNSTDQHNHPIEILNDKSDKVLMEEDMENNGTIFDLYSRDSEPDDGVQDSGMDGNDNVTVQETKNSTPVGKNLSTGAEGEQSSEDEFNQQQDHVLSRLNESPIRGLVSVENNQGAIQERKESLDGNPTGMDGGSKDESRGSNNQDFTLPNPSLSTKILANGEDSSHHLLETQPAGDSPLVQENLAVDLHGEIEATRDQILENLIQIKKEEAIFDPLPIGKGLEEIKVFDNELPVDHAPETKTSTDLQGNLEIEDAPAKFSDDIPAVETNDSSDSFEIPEETEESSNGMMASETEISIDLHTGDASAELCHQIPAPETDDSGDSVDFPEHTKEFGASMLIGKQTAPEPENIHQAASSPPLQQSLSPFLIDQSSDDIGSPAKILALDGDQIEDLAASTVGSPAKTSVQVDDLIGYPQESRKDELGDPAGGFADSDLGTGAPVATPLDHGGYETDGIGIVLEVKGGEDESAAVDTYVTETGGGDDDKENKNGSIPSGLALVYVGGGEAKVKSKAGQPSQPDYDSLSMRKLKAILREKASNLNNKKVEGKRADFSELNGDDGC